MDKENVSPQHSEEPVKKKPRLSLSLKKKRRFGESVSGNLHDLTKLVVPDNTKKNTSWAWKNFNEWRSEREKHFPEEVCPIDFLERDPWDVKELNRWLCLYVHETLRSDGERYPLSTVLQLLSGLLRHVRSIDLECPNFI